MRLWTNVYLLLLLFLVGSVSADDMLPVVKAEESYVVVASKETAEAEEWQKVVAALRAKYDALLILYPPGNVDAALPALRRIHPRYAAFVSRPNETGRDFIVAVHRLTRRLDNDPYTDLRWGIITGYQAADALRIVRRSQPLLVDSAASSMGPSCFKDLRGGFASSETKPTEFWVKSDHGETVRKEVDPDATEALAHAFNTMPPDLFITSGHATEHDWQVGYNVRGGQFRHKDGQLYAFSTQQKRYDINSPHPKIYMPMGNCLIGHIPGRDCMATAWMHTGGVYQMFGYTAVTFHGYMGWGIGTFFNNGYTLAESFYFNNQSLIHELVTSFPDKADIDFDTYDQRRINQLVRKHGLGDRKLVGHLWDRDVVAFYGDPAWEARRPSKNPAWKATYSREGEQITVEVSCLRDGKWGNRPVAIPFPERLQAIRSIECSNGVTPVVTDDFALLPLMGEARVAGESIRLTFGARVVAAVPTSAAADPVLAEAVTDTKKNDRVQRLDLGQMGFSASQARRIVTAVRFAGNNREELAKMLRQAKQNELMDVGFLIGNMPARDLNELTAGYLLENVRYARKALDEAPWKEEISDDLYLDYILPYASLTEKRESWRKMFYEKLKPLVAEIKRPGEAAVNLNRTIYELFGVEYHATKRPRPDQGPLESMEAGYASCTGLSILLVNACRAVGIPARIAGVAGWTDGPGNHTWVEVWDRDWHCLGASESKALDKVWFGKAAASVDTANPLKRVYATCFRRGVVRFPIAWNPYADYIPAHDVSARYQAAFGEAEASKEE